MEIIAALEGNFIPFAAGLAGLGGAIGVGLAGAKGAEAVGRNPGAFGKVFTTTLIAMALAEGLAILGFFVLPGLLKNPSDLEKANSLRGIAEVQVQTDDKEKATETLKEALKALLDEKALKELGISTEESK